MAEDSTVTNTPVSFQNLDSWRLVATQPLPPKLKTISAKYPLKMKIVREQVSGEGQQSAAQEEKPGIKLVIPKYKIKPTVQSDGVTSQKRTPWYLLQRQAARLKPAVQQAVKPEPTPYKTVAEVKQRVANKPRPQSWSRTSREVELELMAKRESCRKKLVNPPKAGDVATHVFADCLAKTKNADETMDEVTGQEEGASKDFTAAKMAREKANLLFNVDGIRLNCEKKSEGFKRPICYERKLFTENFGNNCKHSIDKSFADMFHAEGKHIKTDIDGSNTSNVGCKDKPNGCFQILATRKKEPQANITPAVFNQISKQLETDIKLSSNPRLKQMLGKKPAAKVDGFTSLCSKFQESSESWVQGVGKLCSAFSSKVVPVTVRVCQEPKREKETQPNIEESAKDASPREHSSAEAGKRTTLQRTVCVCLEKGNATRKLLLDSFMKFGTITALSINERCTTAHVTYNGLQSAQRACERMNGLAVPSGAIMMVRMATETDLAPILRLKSVCEVKSVVKQELQLSVWSKIATTLDEDIGHKDSRNLLAYTDDDLFQ